MYYNFVGPAIYAFVTSIQSLFYKICVTKGGCRIIMCHIKEVGLYAYKSLCVDIDVERNCGDYMCCSLY